MPPNLDNIYWGEDPKGGSESFVMHKVGLSVKTVAAGTYRVCVEYHGGVKPVALNNVAEVKLVEQEDDGEAVKPAGRQG